MSPLNFETEAADLVKSFWLLEACSLVLMLSTGKRARSILVPATPPASDATRNVCSVKVGGQTAGLF